MFEIINNEEESPETLRSVVATKFTARGTLFGNRVDCFVLENGQRVVSEARQPSDETSTAWNMAFAAVAREHAMALDVDRVVIQCVDAKRMVGAIEDICWREEHGSPAYRGAWRLLHALAEVRHEALALKAIQNTIASLPS